MEPTCKKLTRKRAQTGPRDNQHVTKMAPQIDHSSMLPKRDQKRMPKRVFETGTRKLEPENSNSKLEVELNRRT